MAPSPRPPRRGINSIGSIRLQKNIVNIRGVVSEQKKYMERGRQKHAHTFFTHTLM